jgi:MYXO-CTERM domain-containing protein
MRGISRTLAAIPLAIAGLCTSYAIGAPIHDLVVLEVGAGVDNGGGTWGGATPGTGNVFLRDYDVTFAPGTNIPSLVLSQRIAVNNAPSAVAGSNRALTIQQTAAAEGGLSLSANGQYFTFGGYNSATNGTTSTGTTERVIGRLDLAGNVDTTTAIATGAPFGGTSNAIRNVTTVDGSEYWIVSSAQGIRHTIHGGTTTTQIATANGRRVEVFDEVGGSNQLYFSAQTTTVPLHGVGTVGTGTPNTGPQTITKLPGMPGSNPAPTPTPSPYDYWFADATTLYVADDQTVANGGGIQKWIYDSVDAQWEIQFTLNTTNYRGLTGVVIGSDVVLFATTAFSTTAGAGANQLVAFNDTLTNTTKTSVVQTLLETSSATSNFRGLDAMPIPEPGGLAVLAVGLLALRRRRANG